MKKTVIFLAITTTVFACNKSNIEISEKDSFPTDTVFINSIYKGSIDYEDKQHDKFTKKLNSESKLRWIITYYVLDTIPYAEHEIYQSSKKDSVLAYNAHKINLRDIEFKKTGTYYISGIIKDNIVLDSVWIDGRKNSEVSQSVFWRKVVVE